MKNFEELENFIKENPKNWQDKLKKAPYNLKSVTQFPNNPNWYLLNYNLIESDLNNKIVKQCRGTCVEVKDNNVKVICAPYIKFFDINDGHADTINWNSSKLKCEEKCVSGDTIIETENGKKTIKEVIEGDDKFVVSINEENGDLEFTEITDKWCKDTDSEWYEIETESGKKLKITGNDFLKLSNGAYRRVDELQVNDEVMIR